MMRDMSSEQRLQCRRFLAELRRTGNVELSADRVGIAQQTWQRRRRAHPAFATQWAAALGFARAALARSGPLPPTAGGPTTTGGEYAVRRGNSGELQVRRAHPGELTEKGEALFLQTLAATCNVKLASGAVGIGAPAIYARCLRSDHFADRMDAAPAQGHKRLEFALMESALHSLVPDEMAQSWAELGVEPPSPLTVMTFDQVIISMGLHMKRVVLGEKRRAHNRRESTVEETDAAITKLLVSQPAGGGGARARSAGGGAGGREGAGRRGREWHGSRASRGASKDRAGGDGSRVGQGQGSWIGRLG